METAHICPFLWWSGQGRLEKAGLRPRVQPDQAPSPSTPPPFPGGAGLCSAQAVRVMDIMYEDPGWAVVPRPAGYIP